MDEKPLYLQVEDRLKANIESGAWGLVSKSRENRFCASSLASAA